MNKIKVSIINKPEICDERLISSLTKLTFSKKLANSDDIREQLLDIDSTTTNIAENTLKFNHTTLLEHIGGITFLLSNISRSNQLQIVRHRVSFSYTASSTHYINYADAQGDNVKNYFVTPIEIMESNRGVQEKYQESCIKSIREYAELIQLGVKPEVARDVLPNSFRSDLLMTTNLRSLKNFFNLRLCGVNTTEINYTAMLMYKEIQKLFPMVAKYLVPDCAQPCHGCCNQGKRIENCCFKGWSLEKMEEKYRILNQNS